MVLGRRQILLGGAALLASCGGGNSGTIVSPPPPPPPSVDIQALLNDLSKRTFDFFWETTDNDKGLTPDRWPTLTFCSIAAVGFALTAYCIGVANNFVSREAAAQRTLNTLKFLYDLPQSDASSGTSGYKGFYYHFLNFSDGCRFQKCELSSIDTSLFLVGAITAQEFFDANNEIEAKIREYAQKHFDRVEWGFLTRPSGLLGMGWHPETGFIKSEWEGYSEGALCYLLGMASNTFPIPKSAWEKWCSTYDLTWGKNGGSMDHVGYFSLATHQIPNLWHDLRGLADPYMKSKGLTYYENARRATLNEREYAIQNPMNFADYEKDIWGWTACEGPYWGAKTINGRNITFRGYSERGPGTRASFDDGTITPTAGLGSLHLTPDESLSLLAKLRTKYGDDIYGKYGFFDAFNPSYKGNLPSDSGKQTPTAGWVSNDYLGLDQGPILIAIENHKTDNVRKWFKKSPIAARGIRAAGFEIVGSDGEWLRNAP